MWRRFTVSTPTSMLTDLARALARSFELIPTDRPSPETLAAMATKGFLVLFTRDGSWRLEAKPGRFDGVRALDGGWLETALADVPLTVTYQHGLEETLVRSGQRARLGGGIDPARQCRRDRTDRSGRPADATEVHILHPQAQDRLRHPFTDRMRGVASLFGEDLAQLCFLLC